MRNAFSNAYNSNEYTSIFSYDPSKFSACQGLSIAIKKTVGFFDLDGIFEDLVQLSEKMDFP